MKKGFTLIEIIVVILLIAVIGVGSTVAITISNNKKENNVLVDNEHKFANALEVYLSTHPEVINNVNNNVEGAIVTLEVLKNEGLISDNLNIKYDKNYYVVTSSLLSNKTIDNINVIKEECENNVLLESISSWIKDEDSSIVMYFCPKKQEEAECPECLECSECEEELSDPVKMCENGTFESSSLACNIINNAKNVKNNNLLKLTTFGEDLRTNPKETIFRKETLSVNITDSDFGRDIYFLSSGYINVPSENYKNYYSGFTTKERNAILSWVSENLAAGKDVYFSPRDRCNYYRDTSTWKYHYTCNGGANETVSKIISLSDDCTKNGCEIKYKLVDTYNSTVRSLETEEDNFGKSYYFKGNVIDNYVNFAGMCWRIVRIEGDGSVKLILSSQTNTCKNDDKNSIYSYVAYGGMRDGRDDAVSLDYQKGIYGVGYNDARRVSGSTMLRNALNDFFNNKLSSYKEKLKKERICLEHYDIDENGNEVLNNNTLKCNTLNDTSINSTYIAPITYGELLHSKDENHSYLDFVQSKYKNAYSNTGNCAHVVNFWTITPVGPDSFYAHSSNGQTMGIGDADTGYGYANCGAGARPAIILKPGIPLEGGSGTMDDPYIIK